LGPLAAAIAYAREGADVATDYFLNEEPDAQDVLQLIKDAGRKGFLIPGDLRDEAFCKNLINDAVKELGGLDILVCNAARQQAHDSNSRHRLLASRCHRRTAFAER
jgi:NAD(P)-dependent dehydrogenase (short-subunit alcohol dehydrogenase family)